MTAKLQERLRIRAEWLEMYFRFKLALVDFFVNNARLYAKKFENNGNKSYLQNVEYRLEMNTKAGVQQKAPRA